MVKAFSAITTALLLGSRPATAADLLTINTLGPSNVTISSTGGIASQYTVGTYANGYVLVGFVLDSTSAGRVLAGSLAPTYHEHTPLVDAHIENGNLSLYNSLADSTSTFVNVLFQAFSGSSTLDLSGISLATTGGNIELNGIVIGEYEVVPEPSTVAFGLIYRSYRSCRGCPCGKAAQSLIGLQNLWRQPPIADV